MVQLQLKRIMKDLSSLKEVFDFLKNYDNVNIIDVGCASGSFKEQYYKNFQNQSYWIGVEPNPIHKQNIPYDLYFGNAIDDVNERVMKPFYFNQDSYCSSLLEINNEILTNDINKMDELWYTSSQNYPFNVISVDDVEVVSLKILLDEIPKFENELIHFLKVDAQGVDIRVVQSLREYIPKTLFVMIESVVSKNPNLKLYKNQTQFSEDDKIMNELGFRKLFDIDYSQNSSPEADVVYVNINLINN